MLKRPYRPLHGENRMWHEGDVARARQEFLAGRTSANLRHLLTGRYDWMNEFIRPGDVGVEVGCGAGLSKKFIRAAAYYLSDLADYNWLDFKHVNALATPFAAGSFDFVVSSNMIHHVPSPLAFFDEMWRILRPEGRLLIQEINASLLMRLLLRAMRHEGYSFDVDVFDSQTICTDPDDLWSANCAIPNLLFDDLATFQRHVTGFQPVMHRYAECLSMINSGGVIARTIYLPLPDWMLKLIALADRAAAWTVPQLLAMQRQLVLEKRMPPAELQVATGADHQQARYISPAA